MSRTIFLSMLSLPTLCLSPIAQAMPSADAKWETLMSTPVQITCTTTGEAWCKTSGTVSAPIDRVATALEDMGSSDKVFESVRSVNMVETDILHVTIDFPTPFSDRDYVSRYTKSTEGDTRLYTFTPVEHAKAPKGDAVRLEKMAGQWRLSPKADNTLVTYMWQADLGGSFPSWAYPTARKRTGEQILSDLAKSNGATISPPK